jgi:hypothetical protein
MRRFAAAPGRKIDERKFAAATRPRENSGCFSYGVRGSRHRFPRRNGWMG